MFVVFDEARADMFKHKVQPWASANVVLQSQGNEVGSHWITQEKRAWFPPGAFQTPISFGLGDESD